MFLFPSPRHRIGALCGRHKSLSFYSKRLPPFFFWSSGGLRLSVIGSLLLIRRSLAKRVRAYVFSVPNPGLSDTGLLLVAASPLSWFCRLRLSFIYGFLLPQRTAFPLQCPPVRCHISEPDPFLLCGAAGMSLLIFCRIRPLLMMHTRFSAFPVIFYLGSTFLLLVG